MNSQAYRHGNTNTLPMVYPSYFNIIANDTKSYALTFTNDQDNNISTYYQRQMHMNLIPITYTTV